VKPAREACEERSAPACRLATAIARIAGMVGTTPSMITLAAALLILAPSGTARADSLNDYFGPREISVGESLRANAQGSLATTLNPAGLALTRQLVFEGSYGYRGDDSASTVAASACDSTVPVAGCFYYHYFTAKPEIDGVEYSRRVHEFGVAAARAISRRMSVGLNARYFDYKSDLTGEADSSGFATDAGLTLSLSDAIQAAVVGYNLLAPNSRQYPMAIGAGIVLHPVEQLSIGLDGLWNLDLPDGESGTGRYGGGLEYFIPSGDQQIGYPFRFGTVYDHQLGSTYITGGLGLTTMKIGVDVGARKQVGGGDELMILGSLRLFGPHLP
jgi:hypothetical protein